MKKRISIWFLSCCAVVLTGFAILTSSGCSKPQQNNGIVLTCIGWGAVEETKIVQSAVDDFKKAHPGVEVVLQRAPYNGIYHQTTHRVFRQSGA